MQLAVIGGGLAGCEAAWQAAERGIHVGLYEMRPLVRSGVHHTDLLGELVCTDYLGPDSLPVDPGDRSRAQPLVREELRIMGSVLMKSADRTRIHGKSYFAVDKKAFATEVTQLLSNHPNITIFHGEVRRIPEIPAILATGPLTTVPLGIEIAQLLGKDQYFGFESSAPLIDADSIDYDIVRPANGQAGDANSRQLWCPLSMEEFDAFYAAMRSALRTKPHVVEQIYIHDVRIPDLPRFDRHGGDALEDQSREDLLNMVMTPPATVSLGPGVHAVATLLQNSGEPKLYKMIGFQTRLKHGEQERVFRKIPGLQRAKFVRFGHMHLSCYVNARQCLATLQCRKKADLFFAGELSGTDTYLAAIAGGWLAGQNAARLVQRKPLLVLPATTMLGALFHYLAYSSPDAFQPMIPNVFLVYPRIFAPDLDNPDTLQQSYSRSMRDLKDYLAAML